MTDKLAAARSDFLKNGYLGPFSLLSQDEADALGHLINREFERNRFRPLRAGRNRHLDLKPIAALCRSGDLIDAASAVLGRDLLLWRTQMFFQVRERVLPWHQDLFNNLLDDSSLNISAHIAITAASETNCMAIIPGSHRVDCAEFGLTREVGPSPNAYGNQRFIENSDPPAAKMIMAPGQFILFDNRIIHRTCYASDAQPRLAFVMRITTPAVRVLPEAFGEIPKVDHSAVLLSGEDSYRLNQLGRMPE